MVFTCCSIAIDNTILSPVFRFDRNCLASESYVPVTVAGISTISNQYPIEINGSIYSYLNRVIILWYF
ncbi:hypothetical protein ES708_30549 [subsurface metagenome]